MRGPRGSRYRLANTSWLLKSLPRKPYVGSGRSCPLKCKWTPRLLESPAVATRQSRLIVHEISSGNSSEIGAGWRRRLASHRIRSVWGGRLLGRHHHPAQLAPGVLHVPRVGSLRRTLVRKDLGNNMAIYFGKDILVGLVFPFLVRRRSAKATLKLFRPPFLLFSLFCSFSWVSLVKIFNPNSAAASCMACSDSSCTSTTCRSCYVGLCPDPQRRRPAEVSRHQSRRWPA